MRGKFPEHALFGEEEKKVLLSIWSHGRIRCVSVPRLNLAESHRAKDAQLLVRVGTTQYI